MSYPDKQTIPMRIRDADEMKKAMADGEKNADQVARLHKWVDRVATGLPSIGDEYTNTVYYLNNTDVSECYHCDKVTIWIGDSIAWPRPSGAPPANPDLPDEIATDYYEAGQIVDASPRGAAAILRLAIQKLCKHLGEPGKNINDDIASLVKKGLDARVQRMLDIVRITGNNAVHPGEIDVQDNRELAEKLFHFVNTVADIMISQPKGIEAVWGQMPEGARQQVEKRDK